jgi:hypothetical protein
LLSVDAELALTLVWDRLVSDVRSWSACLQGIFWVAAGDGEVACVAAVECVGEAEECAAAEPVVFGDGFDCAAAWDVVEELLQAAISKTPTAQSAAVITARLRRGLIINSLVMLPMDTHRRCGLPHPERAMSLLVKQRYYDSIAIPIAAPRTMNACEPR